MRLIILLVAFIMGCVSDTGAIYVTEKGGESELDCTEILLTLTCQEASDEVDRLRDICVQSDDRETCRAENCVVELEEKLQTSTCQEDCYWQG